MDPDAKYIETFRQEAHELLRDIEDALLDLENSPDDKECVHRLFRAMHTIKGSGAMWGFDDIADVAHHAETFMERIREGAVPVTGDCINAVFMVRDQIKAMLDADLSERADHRVVCEDIVSRLRRLMSDGTAEAATSAVETDAPVRRGEEAVFRIRFHPDKMMMKRGMDPALFLRKLRDLGECDFVGHAGNVPPLAGLEPETLYLHWNIVLSTKAGLNAVKDEFIFWQDDSQVVIQKVENRAEAVAMRPRLGEILIDRGDVKVEDIDGIVNQQKRLGELLVERGNASRSDILSALMEQKILEKRQTCIDAESIRISSLKLDRLINLVGEIVVAQAHMSHLTEDHENTVFAAPVKKMERLAGELRKFALDMRMLPVETLLRGFRRLVRDLSSGLGKDVELLVEGGQTELDKTILERLHDPLVHLIRNSVDHGLGSPEEREKTGKTRKGLIRIAAAHRGARIQIQVSDDGAGIDLASVLEKAMENGLVSRDEHLTEPEILELIFTPGFSTARKVTDVSGRGVGLDIVKQEINALGGTIEIDNVPGQGAAFNLSLPLTLAIIEGLHVRVGDMDFIIPVSHVETCGEMKKQPGGVDAGVQQTLRLKDDLIPFIRLRDFFGAGGEPPTVAHLAAVQTGHYRIGVVVDEILGNTQAVVKPLDPLYRHAEGISGATVMGNGRIAFIIDLLELIRCVKEEGSLSARHRQ